MLTATLLTGCPFDNHDKRADRNGAREERKADDKRETRGVWGQLKRLSTKEEQPSKVDERPQDSPRKVEENYGRIKIQIGTLPPEKSDKNTVGAVIGGATYTYKALDKYLQERAKLSTETPVLLLCPLESPHGNLIKVIDLCYKYKMYKIAILSQ